MNPKIQVGLQTFWLLTIIPAASLAILLLISTVTLPGALVGIGVLLLWLAFPWIGSEKAGTRWFHRVGTAAGLALLFAAWLLVPPGKNPQPSHFSSIHKGRAKFRSWVPSQVVPEIDQHLMGSRLFTILDPLIDGRQARHLRDSLKEIYLPMRDDPEFAATGNAMGICYHGIAFGQRKSGHRYEYVPEHGREDPMPVILFLHGSLGNFKGYLWVWKQFADASGVAIVAPSFGFGEWRKDGGIRVITETFDQCRNDPRFDPDRIFLAGLSNGGAGVTIAIPEIGDQVAGPIYFSPVLELEAVHRPEIRLRLDSLPILVISGGSDRRIPVYRVNSAVESMHEANATIEFHGFHEEDHFLFFSKPDEVVETMTNWFRKHESRTSSDRVTPSASAGPAR